MCGCYESIYVDAQVRYGEPQSWSLSLQPEEIRSVTESARERLGTSLEQGPTAGVRLSTPWPRIGRSAKWALKITQRGMIKRRSYGSI